MDRLLRAGRGSHQDTGLCYGSDTSRYQAAESIRVSALTFYTMEA